jgi:hypothetical protein
MSVKIIPILLLFGFIMSSVTNHVLFQIERIYAFRLFSTENKIEQSQHVQIFKYEGQPGFHWEKLNKEFSFNGKLYDVISIRDTSCSGLEINCIADQHEDSIVSSYLELIDTTKNSKGWISFQKLKSNDYTPPGISTWDKEVIYSYPVILLNPSIPTPPYLEIFSPPPKLSTSLPV